MRQAPRKYGGMHTA